MRRGATPPAARRIVRTRAKVARRAQGSEVQIGASASLEVEPRTRVEERARLALSAVLRRRIEDEAAAN
jgi:hypothetical protein